MTKPTSVTIAICTRNRAAALAQTLEAMRAVRVPAEVCAELLVVDNGSTDDTPRVARAAAWPGVTVRHVIERKPGVAHGRNRAVHEAQGEIVIYADDDVRPEPDWLELHVGAYADPDVAAVQGRSRIAFESPPPAWYRLDRHGAPGWVDYGAEPVFPHDKPLVTLNASVRRDAARAIGGFHTMLGPGRSGVYEDDDFSHRLRQAGYRQLYEPLAVVTHVLPGDRLTPHALRRRAFDLGVSLYVASAFYGTAEVRHPYRELARWSWRRLKMEIKHLLIGDRGVVPQTEQFQMIAAGTAWAAWQGRKRLAQRFGEDAPGASMPTSLAPGA